MKIAILNKYQNKVNRGAETFIIELTKRLDKNHTVEIIDKVNYFKILKNKYNLIIPTNGRTQAFITRLITWITGSKMIISGHSGIGLDDRLNLYSFPDYFVALSTKALNWAKIVNPLVKSVYIPNGIDLNKFKDNKNNVNKLKTVLAVGAFTKEKRHDLVINAVAKIDNVNLIITGSGGDIKQEILNLGKKMLGDRFKAIETEYKKMPEIYQMANLLVFPAVPWESFGITLLEAMASGLPIVASNDPIRREIVGDAGLFVDPTNIDNFVITIKKALETNWGDKPRKQAEKFNWDIIAVKYEELFRHL